MTDRWGESTSEHCCDKPDHVYSGEVLELYPAMVLWICANCGETGENMLIEVKKDQLATSKYTSLCMKFKKNQFAEDESKKVPKKTTKKKTTKEKKK